MYYRVHQNTCMWCKLFLERYMYTCTFACVCGTLEFWKPRWKIDIHILRDYDNYIYINGYTRMGNLSKIKFVILVLAWVVFVLL